MHQHHSMDHNNSRIKHNPKSCESFERKSSTTKKPPPPPSQTRGSMRRTFSLQPDASAELAAAAAAEVMCPCVTHPGKETLNKIFNLNINYLFECLFEKNDFDSRFAQLTKKFEVKKSNWYVEKGERTKKYEYKIEINNPFVNTKFCENCQIMKVLKAVPSELYVVETDTRTFGVPYAECFNVITRFCLIKCDVNLTKLVVHTAMNFSSKPNFLIKNLIEKNGYASLNEHFAILCRSLEEESILKRNAPPAPPPMVVTSKDIIETEADSRHHDGYSSSSSTASSTRSILGSSYSPSISSESVLSSEESSCQASVPAATAAAVENLTSEMKPPKVKKSPHHSSSSLSKEERRRKKDLGVEHNSPSFAASSAMDSRFKLSGSFYGGSQPGSSYMVQAQYPSLVLSPEFFVKMFFILMLLLIGFNVLLFVKLVNIENITQHLIAKQKNL